MSQAGQFVAVGAASFDTLTGDVGGAISPVAGNINILGGTNMNTGGAGNTITVNLDDSLTLVGSLEVGTTVTLTSITDGALISSSTGVVTTSAGLMTPSGFATWGGAGNYYDDSVLGDFEILRPGTGYINGVLVSWAGSQTISGITAGNTYLIFIDSTGTIGKTTSFDDHTVYQANIALFEVMRDSTGTNIQYTVKENHPYDFPQSVSAYNHDVIGTVIENQKQGANITLNGTQKIEIVGADELDDHGLHTIIPDGGGVAESFNQMYTDGSGKWATYTASDTFDGFWNSAGTATAPSGNKFSIYTLYVSKDDLTTSTPIFWAVLDDQEYNNLGAAQSSIANNSVSISTSELQLLELAQLGHIIYKQSTSTIADVIIEKATLRSTTSGGSGTNLAALVITDVSNFDGILSASDTTVQISLETIDEWGKTTTDHALLVGGGTGFALDSLAVGTNGQVVIGSTGADPAFATIISSDASITFTPGAGTLDMSAAGVGVAWTEVTGTSQAMAVNSAYILNNAGLVTATLPVTAGLGTTFRLVGKGAGGWKLAQNAGQTTHFGTSVTTTGAGGSLASTDDNDSIHLVCITADTDFSVISSVGNITIV